MSAIAVYKKPSRTRSAPTGYLFFPETDLAFLAIQQVADVAAVTPVQHDRHYRHGNNDRWIAIQNYRQEDWNELVQLWKCTNMHVVHVIRNINPEKLDNVWISGLNEEISLEEMVMDFPRHFKLHLSEIDELINLPLEK